METAQNTATVSFSKVADVITANFVKTVRHSQLGSAIANFDTIVAEGTAKPAKMKKAIALIESCGFRMTQTNYITSAGFEGQNADVVNYSVTFVK